MYFRSKCAYFVDISSADSWLVKPNIIWLKRYHGKFVILGYLPIIIMFSLLDIGMECHFAIGNNNIIGSDIGGHSNNMWYSKGG